MGGDGSSGREVDADGEGGSEGPRAGGKATGQIETVSDARHPRYLWGGAAAKGARGPQVLESTVGASFHSAAKPPPWLQFRKLDRKEEFLPVQHRPVPGQH